jgi:O-antigen/teichoic acid export membrane protein
MGLLALFAKTFVDYGIFYSWASPIFLINIVVSTILFKVVIPKHVKETEADAETQGFRQILQFVGGDYLSAMVWNASTSFIPLLIIERLGAEANAYFYFPWLIAYSLYMVSRNLGMSLTVEAAKDQARLSEFSRRSLKHSLTLLIPMVLVAIVGSRLILEIFGHQYSLEGEVLLRYLALSAIPYSIISLYVSIARVQRKILHMMAALSSMSILSVILTFLWIDPYGLQGVGLAWLVGQSSVAIVLLFTGLRTFLFGSKMVEDVSKNVAKT